MKISATLRKDPTMTKRLVNSYERELVDIFERAKDDLRFVVEVSRVLEAPAKVDVPMAKIKVSTVLNDVVLGGASGKVRSHVIAVQKTARLRTDQLLKAINVEPAIGTVPADKGLEQILIERNIGALKGLTDEMGKEISRELTDGISRGEGIDKLVRRIDSVSDMGVERARLIARTETLYAYNATAIERYKRNGIEMMEWLAAKDERLCDACMDLDGERFTMLDWPDCPLHPNCRCTMIPVIEEVA